VAVLSAVVAVMLWVGTAALSNESRVAACEAKVEYIHDTLRQVHQELIRVRQSIDDLRKEIVKRRR
jgi:hypothetical protein